MHTYISLLRGINVSGHKMIKMDELRSMFADLSFKNVLTYMQSGNVIFQDKNENIEVLEKKITSMIIEKLGFEIPTIVHKLAEINSVLKNNPFINNRDIDLTKLYVIFLSQKPVQANIDKIIHEQYNPDEFIVKDKVIYLFCHNGYGKTKLNNNFFENKLKVVATTRNWKTIGELVNLAERISKK